MYTNELEYLISDVAVGVVSVCSAVWVQDRVTWETLIRGASGRTDANGFVALNCYISWDYDPDLIDMMAYVSSSGYTTIQATGNYTTTGNTLYPEFWVKKDLDQNHVPDDWELPLAEEFCPTLKLNHPIEWIRPSPSEVMTYIIERDNNNFRDTIYAHFPTCFREKT